MTRALLAAVALALALVPHPAAGHPLGNFTVNRYARLEPAPNALTVVYLVDFAEIPTLLELSAFPAIGDGLDPEANGRQAELLALRESLAKRFASGLSVAMNGREAPLRLRTQALEIAPGTGDAPTMRLRLELDAKWPGTLPVEVAYADRNDPDRLGWREVVLRPVGGATVGESTVAWSERSRELTAYPSDPAADFPQETSGRFRLTALTGAIGAAPGATLTPPGLTLKQGDRGGPGSGGLVALVTRSAERGLTLPLALTALLAAAALGAGHAFSPGHGKTIVGAYLVGTRSRTRDAVVLGAIVTATHTALVFALGLAALFASRYILPERLYPWLGAASGALVAVVGASMLHERIERAIGIVTPHRHLFWTHAQPSPVASDGGPSAARDGEAAVSWRSLATLGVSGGLVPCPSAIVVLLTAVALNRVAFGLLLIVAFSAGLASVLILIGLVFVHARRLADHVPARAGFVLKALPIVSALLVCLFGLAIAVQSVIAGGLVTLAR